MNKDIWSRRRGLCDSCHAERVPVAFLKIRYHLHVRLCRDCLAEAMTKVAQEGDRSAPIEAQGL